MVYWAPKVVGEGVPAPEHLPIARFLGELQGVLGIYLTNKCTMRCAHCCTDSAPECSSVLDVQAILEELRSACARGPISAIHVSGGEPFLYPALLRRVGEVVSEHGLAYAVNTNAFWAKSPEQALERLKRIQGLSQIMVSADRYHEPFQPLERIVHAATAGISAGIHVQVCFCTPEGKVDQFVDHMLSLFSDDIRQRIAVSVTPVEPGGRANHLPEARWRPLTRSLPDSPCPLVNRPVILEDGRVQACCNTVVRDQLRGGPLDLGHVSDESLSDILERGARSPVVRALRSLGPGFLASCLPDELREAALQPYPRGDLCSVCTRMMTCPSTVAAIEKALEEPRIMRLLFLAENILTARLES